MIESVTDRLQARFAHRLLEQAKREIGHPRPRLTGRLMIAFILSILVLLTPFLLIIGGGALIWITWANLFSIIIGLILIGFGYVLLPPRNRNTQKTYRRADLPALFALLDDIAARLGTTAPDGVHFDNEFNAYMGQFTAPSGRRQEWILGIGLILWEASSPAERIAHLAHELAHKVNEDPMRHGVFFRANWVLNNWYDTFEMNLDNDMDGGFTQIIGLAVVGGYIKLLSRYWFFESQRAEYRADAFASRVSGNAANITSLEMLTRHDLARRAIVDLYPYTKDQSGRIFDHIGAAVSDASLETVDRFLAEAAQEKRCVDASHPPTVMRIEFLRSLPAEVDQDAINMADIDFGPIDAEIRPIKDALGKEFMQDLYDSEVNR
ncbi:MULTISPECIES: M48 family metallopeptidase [unclassified Roseovarius]|uniref:M48 family metallopeptidase n=1 Tax=unclassified Roseovarius TaxID=2614913 RepID=UPI00273EB2FD|nr:MULTISPECIES: M48 family metallopeptidase [unclassified Roseovarius]